MTLVDDNVWLTADQMATLFQRNKSTISRHIKSIFESGELEPDSVVAFFATTAVDTLNRIVSLYLDFAELQAKSHVPMYMADWIQKLDDFLKLSGKELLTHAGSISAELAQKKAHFEYDNFKKRTQLQLSPVEIHFLEFFDNARKKLR